MLVSVILTPALFGQSTLPAPKQEKLLNGLKVLMWPDAKADKVSVKLRIHSGSAFDPQGKEGLMQMLADNLFPNEAAREFFKEDLGGDLEIITNYDYVQINVSSKSDSESFLKMLEMVSTAVSNPPIDKETTGNLRAALLAKLASLETDPNYVADQAVAKRLFGTFPYGRPQLGTAESLKKIDFPDLVDEKNRFLNADNATLAISGNFDKAAGLRAVKRYFGGWAKADKKIPATFRQPDEPNTEPLSLNIPDFNKTFSEIAKNAPARADKAFYSMFAFGYFLGEQDCHYFANYETYLLRGIFIAQLESNSKTAMAASPCAFVTRKMMGSEIRQEDFDKAKAKMVAYFQGLMTSPAELAGLWLDVDTYGLGSPEEVLRKAMSVSLADVRSLIVTLSASPTVKIVINPPSSN